MDGEKGRERSGRRERGGKKCSREKGRGIIWKGRRGGKEVEGEKGRERSGRRDGAVKKGTGRMVGKEKGR